MCELVPALIAFIAEAADTITAVAAVCAAVIAYIGLRTWRDQLKGSAEYTLAKDILKAVYGVREAFKHVRNPAIFVYEYPEELRDSSANWKPGFQSKAHEHVYEQRFKVLIKAVVQLEERVLDGEVEWGASFGSLILPIRKCRARLQMTLQDHLEALSNNSNKQGRSEAAKKANDDSVLYYLGEEFPEQDRFTSDINSAIAGFELRLRPIIDKRNEGLEWLPPPLV